MYGGHSVVGGMFCLFFPCEYCSHASSITRCCVSEQQQHGIGFYMAKRQCTKNRAKNVYSNHTEANRKREKK